MKKKCEGGGGGDAMDSDIKKTYLPNPPNEFLWHQRLCSFTHLEED